MKPGGWQTSRLARGKNNLPGSRIFGCNDKHEADGNGYSSEAKDIFSLANKFQQSHESITRMGHALCAVSNEFDAADTTLA